MPQRPLTIYGAIALTTSLLVLAKALFSSADRVLPAAIALRPLLAEPPWLNAAAQTLALAHRAWIMQPQARIVAEHTKPLL